ncbi:MAG TPA: phosphotransferase [Methylovirgula sp.]|nr:phosphotransferase [Methylovirgula sp.]
MALPRSIASIAGERAVARGGGMITHDAPMSQNETTLIGGRTTLGVVRLGETVRRPPTPNLGFVRALLRHLEAVGFDGAPRYLGTDESGREIYSYIPGVVPAELGEHDDKTLENAARLIRAYHDATAPLFATPSAQKVCIEVACHNDLSPCNTVFRDGHPVAFIDFDAAAPGSRSYDLGYAAWLWLDLGNPDRSTAEQVRRLRVFLAAYGSGPSEAEVIAAALERQAILIAEGMRTGNTAMSDWAANCSHWTRQQMRPAL